MDAVIYTRVSRDTRGERVSVQSQERECRAVCARNGWPVREVYCDNSIGASRFSADRPEWKRLKDDLRRGEVLVVWESSRAQRDLEEFITLRNLCAEKDVRLSYQGRVLDLSEGDDRFQGGLDALLAERESEYIRKRVLRGKLDAAESGKPPCKPPWGYRRTGVGEWELDPIEAPRVREAVERLLAGETQYTVHEWLKSTGFAPSTPTTLRRALLNPALAGLRQHQGTVVGKAAWSALITEKQHEQLKARNSRMRVLYGRNSPQGPEPKYLLSGIAKCGVCGEGLRHRAKEGRKPYYTCYMGHVSRLVDMLDQAVERAIFKRLSGVDPSEYESTESDDAGVLAEIDELERQLVQWEEEAIAGRVSPAVFGRAEKSLNDRIACLRAKIEAPSEFELDPSLWPEMSMVERRQVVRALFTVVVPKLPRRMRAVPGDVQITPI